MIHFLFFYNFHSDWWLLFLCFRKNMCAYPTNQVHFGSFNTKNWKSALKGLSSPRPATKNCEIVAGGHRKPFPATKNRENVASRHRKPRPATKNCENVAGGHRKPFPAMENREIVAGGLFPVGKHRIKNHRIQID